MTQISATRQTDVDQGRRQARCVLCFDKIRKGYPMMNGYNMGYGGIWMVVVGVLVVLAIAALIKYLRK